MMTMIRNVAAIATVAVVVLLTGPVAAAQAGFAQSGAKFLTIGGGARSLALSETYVTETDDPFGVFYNPAGFSGEGSVRAGLAHNEFFQNSRGEYAALVIPSGRLSAGIGMRYFIVNDIPRRTNPTPQPLGVFDASDAEIKGVVGYQLSEDVRLGLALKGVFEKISSEVANGIAFDVGATYAILDKVSVGAAINHIGPDMTFAEESYHLPTTVRLGGAYGTDQWSVRGELVSLRSESADVHLGSEYTFLVPTGSEDSGPLSAAFRAGYIVGHDTRSWSAGAGVGFDRFQVNYAFGPHKDHLGDTHRFGLQVKLK